MPTASHVPSTKVREIAAMLKAIHASEDIVAARKKAVRVMKKLRTLRLNKAAELVESAVEETLTFWNWRERLRRSCRSRKNQGPTARCREYSTSVVTACFASPVLGARCRRIAIKPQ
jgi:transposase-like protein